MKTTGFIDAVRNKQYGDAVEIVTSATGIKSVVEAASNALGVDCGCEARKQKWNKK